MDENEKIDEIKEKLLDRINTALEFMTTEEVYPNDVRRTIIIKKLIESYDILNNIYQEDI